MWSVTQNFVPLNKIIVHAGFWWKKDNKLKHLGLFYVINRFSTVFGGPYLHQLMMLHFTTPGRRQSKTLSTIADQKSIETVFLIAICRQCGNKWQSKTLFITTFDLRSSIVLAFLIATYCVYDTSRNCCRVNCVATLMFLPNSNWSPVLSVVPSAILLFLLFLTLVPSFSPTPLLPQNNNN